MTLVSKSQNPFPKMFKAVRFRFSEFDGAYGATQIMAEPYRLSPCDLCVGTINHKSCLVYGLV